MSVNVIIFKFNLGKSIQIINFPGILIILQILTLYSSLSPLGFFSKFSFCDAHTLFLIDKGALPCPVITDIILIKKLYCENRVVSLYYCISILSTILKPADLNFFTCLEGDCSITHQSSRNWRLHCFTNSIW